MNDKQLPRPEIISKIDGFLDMLSYEELQFFNRRVYEKIHGAVESSIIVLMGN